MSQHFRRIEQLRGWRQTVFLLALAERSYPNFALFGQLSGQVNHELLRRTLDALWDDVSDRESSLSYRKIAEMVEAQQPDPAQFEGYGVYPAADACSLTLDVLFSRLEPDRRLAVASARTSLNTVTDFVEMTDAEGVEEDELAHHLDRHPLVKRELRFQRELVEALQKAPFPSADLLASLRELACDEGVSNIGIALDDEAEAE